MVVRLRSTRRFRPGFNTSTVKTPFGYGVYKAVMGWRHPTVRVRLSPHAYRKSPLHAFSIAFGLKPKRLTRNVRSLRKTQYGIR